MTGVIHYGRCKDERLYDGIICTYLDCMHNFGTSGQKGAGLNKSCSFFANISSPIIALINTSKEVDKMLEIIGIIVLCYFCGKAFKKGFGKIDE